MSNTKAKGKTITNPGGRILVVGDLHGCLVEARNLLWEMKVTPQDKVIFLGDLVDRGPDSAGCVDLAMSHESILGNHEERHLEYWARQRKGQDPKCSIPTHVETRRQLRLEHYEYMASLPHFIRLPEHNAVVVHAGVFPGTSIEQQSPHHLLHLQMIKPPNRKSYWPSKVPAGEEGWLFWTHLWDGVEQVIFGHSVLTKPLVTERVVGIDGGAVYGRELWGLELPSGKLYSVRGRSSYSRREPNTFQISPDVRVFS